MSPQLTIVIPAWNEAKRLPAGLKKLHEYCSGLGLEWEVVVVVEPGEDRTLELARQFAQCHSGFEVIAQPIHRGKGHAVRVGMLAAQGDLVFYMDADLSVPLREVAGFLSYFQAHPEIDVLIGDRSHARSRITRRQSVIRRSMGKLFNRILQWSGLTAIHDTQCGFKAFRKEPAKAIFAQQRIHGFAFDVEVLVLAERMGYALGDLPVEWINSPESRVHIVRDSLQMLRDTVRIRRVKG